MQYLIGRNAFQGSFTVTAVAMTIISLVTTASRADTVYTSLFDNGTIATLDTTASPPTPTTFAAGFENPGGLAFNSAGDLFVSNVGGSTISEITPGGTVSTFASGLSEPEGLVFDSAGNLYVASAIGGNSILKITPSGVVTTFASTGLDAPVGLAIDSAGDIYAANQFSGTIEKFTPGGVASVFVSGLNTPDDLVFGPNGNLYVSVANGFGSSSGSVLEYTGNGMATTILTGLNNPANMAFDSQGNLYVANLGGTIDEITPGGTVSVFASGLAGPNGLVIMASAVPEPASLVTGLIGLGLAGGFVAMKRRRPLVRR